MTKEFLQSLGINDEKTIENILEANCYDMHEVEVKCEFEWKRAKCFTFHCKPCANFQTIEYEYEIDSFDELPEMFDLYRQIQTELQTIGTEQKPVANTYTPAFEAPTEKQKAIMDKYKIRYNINTSKRDAQKLIKESFEALK